MVEQLLQLVTFNWVNADIQTVLDSSNASITQKQQQCCSSELNWVWTKIYKCLELYKFPWYNKAMSVAGSEKCTGITACMPEAGDTRSGMSRTHKKLEDLLIIVALTCSNSSKRTRTYLCASRGKYTWMKWDNDNSSSSSASSCLEQTPGWLPAFEMEKCKISSQIKPYHCHSHLPKTFSK